MIKFPILLFVFLIFSFSSYGQNTKQKEDVNSIKSMCGCYEVGFNFAETFSYSDDSTYIPSSVKNMKALEWAQLVSEEEDKVVIQHLLVVGKPSNPMIIKHWRQDWIYENNDFYMFHADNKWKFTQFSDEDVKGQWSQKVYQVDDSPRYEGSGTWVYVDGKKYWESTTDAPLPRREYTKRSDYNVTVRTNRHEIHEDGWIHDQDNSKIIREENKSDFLLAKEKGYNTYKRVDDERCEAAKSWWDQNQDYWSIVRECWDEIYSKNQNLTLADKVEGKRLYDVLFDMDIKSSKKKIKKVIFSYVIE